MPATTYFVNAEPASLSEAGPSATKTLPSSSTPTPSPRHTMVRAAGGLPRRNEADEHVAIDRSDADAVPPVDVPEPAGLGVDGVHHLILGEEEVADAPVLIARVQVVTLLVEDLEAVVATVRDPEAALRVELQGVWRAELAVNPFRSRPTPGCTRPRGST